MAIEPIKGFYVHDEATDTDGVAKYSADALDGDVGEISGFNDAVLPLTENLVAPYNSNRFNGVFEYNAYINSSGELVQHSNWDTTDYIFVGDLQSVTGIATRIDNSNTNVLNFYFLAKYDEDKSFLSHVGNPGVGAYTIEQNVKYIRFSVSHGVYDDVRVISGTYRVGNGVFYEPFNSGALATYLDNNFKSVAKKAKLVGENSLLKDISTEFEITNYYLEPNGNQIYYASSRCTDFLNIYEYSDLYVSGRAPYDTNAFYCLYDKAKVFLYAYTDHSAQQDYHFDLSEILAEYPTANYVRFSSVTEDLVFKRPYTLGEMADEIGEAKYGGKKWVCVGDSLTEENSRTTKHYFDYVSEKTGISVVNMGLSGSGYARKQDTNQAFYQRILNCPTDADVVTIFGSGNDSGAGLELGTASDTGTNTLGGAINTTIDNLYSILPVVQLGIITPTPWVGNMPSDNGWMERYSNLIVEICKRRSIPCLDLFHCSNLNPNSAEVRAAAYSKDDGNGVHPDETGHEIIAPRFKAFLETLLM